MSDNKLNGFSSSRHPASHRMTRVAAVPEQRKLVQLVETTPDTGDLPSSTVFNGPSDHPDGSVPEVLNSSTDPVITQAQQHNRQTDLFKLAGESVDIKRLVRGVWLRSVIGLVVVAILATATYFIINGVLALNKDSSAIINVSGRQRMLSQRGAMLAVELSTVQGAVERAVIRAKLSDVIEVMRTSHDGLLWGNDRLNLMKEHSAEVNAIYFEEPHQLDRQVTTYLRHLETLVSDSQTGLVDQLHTSLQYMLSEAPDRLLTTLNLAVEQYEAEADQKLAQAINYETMLYLFTLLTLLLEALLIYRPLVNRIRNTTEDLAQQQQFSDRVVDTAQALIIGVDQQGRIALFNDYSEMLTGYRPDEVKGERFVDKFIPEAEQAAMKQHQAQLFAGVQTERFESTLITRGGRLLTIEWSDTLLSDPLSRKPLMMLTTGVDITQRKQAEASLQGALHESATLSERLQDEVAHAARLQQALLPEPTLDLPGVRGLAHLTTSTEVGGDYFDYYEVGGYHSVFLVGDVSGHGVASGTLVSAAKMGVYQLSSRGETDPAVMLEHLNSALLTASHDNMFMTMVCFSLDSRNGKLRVANAGHVFPYLWMSADKEWGMLEAEGVPLGRVMSPQYTSTSLDLDVGDRLVLYTDGIVEEENTKGEAFGFERFETLLYNVAEQSPRAAQTAVFSELRRFCGREVFSDDVTVMMVEHHQRLDFIETPVAGQLHTQQAQDAVIMLDAMTFLQQPEALPDHASRQHVVLTYAGDVLSDLLPPACREGVRRVLNSDQEFLRELGWDSLLAQHELPLTDDVYQWIPQPLMQREWVLTHSDDKAFIMQELSGLLAEMSGLTGDMQDIALLMSDELLENSLYGAPRTDGNLPRYAKGTAREVAEEESIRINLLHDSERFGLMVTDHWGTFTPATFLNRLLLNSTQQGIEAGVGGAGMYLMWRMCDYLQIRVLPDQQTQVTLLWSLKAGHNPGTDSGFQFLYHNELNELVLEDEAGNIVGYEASVYAEENDGMWREAG